MTTEKELNDKLSEFAGIKRFTNTPDGLIAWEYPDGRVRTFRPDFIHSLDVCIEWLGPKFEAWEIYYIGYHNGIPRHRVIVTYYGKEYFSYAETPALAFCRAVEAAIDKMEGK